MSIRWKDNGCYMIVNTNMILVQILILVVAKMSINI